MQIERETYKAHNLTGARPGKPFRAYAYKGGGPWQPKRRTN